MTGLEFIYPPYLLIFIALGAAGIAWLMYQRTADSLSPRVRWGLTVFRFLVLFIAGALLLEPSIRSTTRQVSAPVIAIVQDNSESLVIQRDSNWIRQSLKPALNKLMESLKGTQAQAHFFTFDGSLHSEQMPDSLRFDGAETDISGALKNIQKLYNSQNLSAVVLLTDGIPTRGMNPFYTVAGFRQPVYTVLLGDTTPQRDVRITEVLHNELAYLKTESPVKVRFQVNGFEGQRIRVNLSEGNKVIGSQEVITRAGEPGYEADFKVKPEKVGVAAYQISLTTFPDEVTTKNNFRSIFINVLETKIRIGIFAGFPHPDLGALADAFARDDRYEVKEFAHKTATSFYEEPTAALLSEMDLIVLHNFPFSQSDAAWVNQILETVKNKKTPLMVFAGQFTDLRTLQPLYDYMALAPGNQVQQAEEAQIHFTDEYEAHSTFTFSQGWTQLMNNAPPLYRNRSDWRPRADARVFGTAVIRNIVLDYPLYALQQHLGHKSMVFVGENFWRIRSHVSVETGDFEAFDSWLFNNVQWLTVKDDKRKFRVYPAKPLFSGSEPVVLKGQVYDDSYKPMSGVQVTVKMKRPDGTDETLYMRESGAGNHFYEMANLAPGTYTYSAEGVKGTTVVGRDAGQFAVGESSAEHLRLQADHGLLRQIALRTEGKSYSPAQMDQLAKDLAALKSLKPEVKLKKSRSGFDEFKWIFFLLLGLLTVEWVVRKLNSQP